MPRRNGKETDSSGVPDRPIVGDTDRLVAKLLETARDLGNAPAIPAQIAGEEAGADVDLVEAVRALTDHLAGSRSPPGPPGRRPGGALAALLVALCSIAVAVGSSWLAMRDAIGDRATHTEVRASVRDAVSAHEDRGVHAGISKTAERAADRAAAAERRLDLVEERYQTILKRLDEIRTDQRRRR